MVPLQPARSASYYRHDRRGRRNRDSSPNRYAFTSLCHSAITNQTNMPASAKYAIEPIAIGMP